MTKENVQSQITAVIFDFGGVLLKWEPHNALRRYFPDEPQAMETFFNEINFMEWNAHQDRGRSFAEGVAKLSKKFPQYAHVIHGYHEHWEDSIGGQIDGSVAILRALKEKGYLVYGLSNWSAETFPIARKRYNFFDLLDGWVISGEVGLIKPDPEIFELCLHKMNKTANECLFIDDSKINIITAGTMGFDVIHFISPEQLSNEIGKRKLL